MFQPWEQALTWPWQSSHANLIQPSRPSGHGQLMFQVEQHSQPPFYPTSLHPTDSKPPDWMNSASFLGFSSAAAALFAAPHEPKLGNCSASLEKRVVTALQPQRLRSRCCCICQRLSGGNSHNLFISLHQAAGDADCLLSLMYCRKDPHRRGGGAGGQGASFVSKEQTVEQARTLFLSAPSSEEGSLSKRRKK